MLSPILLAGGVLGADGPLPDLEARLVSRSPLRYELRPPPEGIRAWVLPASGGEGDDACPRGNPVAVHWSPKGDHLAVELYTGRSVHLCFYDLEMFRFNQPDARQVIVRRLSAAPAANGGSSASPAPARPGSGKEASGTLASWLEPDLDFAEYQLSWNPYPPYVPALAFVRVDKTTGSHLLGLKSLTEVKLWKAIDLGNVVTAGDSPSQPAWIPPGGVQKADTAMAMVSTAGLTCGHSRIVYVPSISSKGLAGSRRPLTAPCAGKPKESDNADRYPAWSPNPAHDRLAYVRSLSNGSSQLCVLERARDATGASTRCWYDQEKVPLNVRHPVWSADGRFLVYYVERGEASASVRSKSARQPEQTRSAGQRGGPTSSGETDAGNQNRRVAGPASAGATDRQQTRTTGTIEVIDFAGRELSPRFLTKRALRLNPAQGPSMLTDAAGRSWVLSIAEDRAGAPGAIYAFSLGGTTKEVSIGTGLQHLIATNVVWRQDGARLAVTARGYTRAGGVDSEQERVFILPLRVERW